MENSIANFQNTVMLAMEIARLTRPIVVMIKEEVPWVNVQRAMFADMPPPPPPMALEKEFKDRLCEL